jgi:hypothetical protein
MQYTLITKTGKIHIFSVKSCAEQFQMAYGRVIVVADILVDTKTQLAV